MRSYEDKLYSVGVMLGNAVRQIKEREESEVVVTLNELYDDFDVKMVITLQPKTKGDL